MYIGLSGYSQEGICPAGTLEQVWSSKPPCKPRKVLVKLPPPDDPDVLEVIPAQVRNLSWDVIELADVNLQGSGVRSKSRSCGYESIFS